MKVHKFIILLGCLFAPLISHANWIVSGAIGYLNANHHPDSTFRISSYDTNSLDGFNQRHFPSLMLSAKNKFSVPANSFIDYFALGPALYYQKSQFNGDVWELESPEFNNYSYRYTSESLPVLLEGDLYFQPLYRFHPFMTAGIGVSINDTEYSEKAGSDIDPASELHLNNEQLRLAYVAGAGIAYALDQHWQASLRYSYMHLGKADTGTATNVLLQQSLHTQLNSQNVFFALSYS